MANIRIIDSFARHQAAFNIWESMELTGLNLRSTPNTVPQTNNVIITLPAGTLVERLDNVTYPDTSGTGILFFRVRLSTEPGIVGFAAAQQIDPTNPTGVRHFLIKSVSAREAQIILRIGTRLQETCDPVKFIALSGCSCILQKSRCDCWKVRRK